MRWQPLASLHDTHHDALYYIFWMASLPSRGRLRQDLDHEKVRGNGYDGRRESKGARCALPRFVDRP